VIDNAWPRSIIVFALGSPALASAARAENLIKLHRSQLASDLTYCQSPVANQLRLALHTATYWLMLTLLDAIPQATPLAKAEFTTIRSKMLKIAACVTEHAPRIRVHLPTGCPQQSWFPRIAAGLA
jgi:hypothetical protein